MSECSNDNVSYFCWNHDSNVAEKDSHVVNGRTLYIDSRHKVQAKAKGSVLQ